MTIGGFARRIKELTPDDKIKKYMDIILDESSRLEELLSKIRLLLDIQEATHDKESIHAITDDLISSYTELAREKGIKFQFSIEEDIPDVLMDSSQISIALSCLLDNAFEATPEGKSIKLSISHENDMLKIEVIDFGKGIPEDEIDAIFDPFFTSKTRGVGLGLTIVHQIVKNHNGEIKVKSTIGKGTRFTIFIPVLGEKL
jgi:signal transduction histidine kinase